MKTIILNFTFLLFGASLFAQSVRTVDNRPGTTAQFSSLQAAHDASQPGDFIYIHPSPNNYGNISITKEIHLRGIGHGPELANGEQAKLNGVFFNRNTGAGTSASNSSIAGLDIDSFGDDNGSPFTNILIQNNLIKYIFLYQPYNLVIQGNVFNNNSYSTYINFPFLTQSNNIITHNIFIRKANGVAAVIKGLTSSNTFNNNLIVFDNTQNEKNIFDECNNPVVNNNIFLLSSQNTTSTVLSTINSSTINYQNCLTFAYGGQTLTSLSGTNNLNNTNPQFVNIGSPSNPDFSYTKNYKLALGSHAINAGSDGSDIGIFGQGFLFQMKGYPFDLPYPTSININNALVAAGSNLEVVLKAKANVEN